MGQANRSCPGPRDACIRLSCRILSRSVYGIFAGCVVLAMGCGTTRMTDTQRTATEQFLISNAIDQAVAQLDFGCMAGTSVFLDTQYLDNAVDRGYLVSSLRQHMLGCGCLIQEDRTKATYVVEARTGGIGTDRHSLLVGVPQMTVPTLLPGQPSNIPEIPFAKKTDQRGLAKIALFAYNRQTGQPLWQSGVIESLSTSKDVWFLGAGPFQKGSLHQGTVFAGEPLAFPSFQPKEADEKHKSELVPLTQAAIWKESTASPADQRSDRSYLSPPHRYSQQTIGALIRAHLGDPSVAEAEKAADINKTAPTPPVAQAKIPDVAVPPKSPAMPNSGGQAETEPIKVLSTGSGFKPEQ